MTHSVHELAEELPDHQSSRGAEFRQISVEERYPLAKELVIARSQTNASNADWDSDEYRREMRRRKNMYFQEAGRLGISFDEAENIWWSVVHGSPSPHRRNNVI